MTINAASVNPYINIQKQQSTQQQNSISLEGLTLSEIREIMPTEEKYPDFLEFKKEMIKIDMDSEYGAYQFSNSFTNNEPINNALYETLKNDTKFGKLFLISEIEHNMADEYNNMNIVASFVMPTSQDEQLHARDFLTKKEKHSIDFDSFISKMLKTFTKDLDEAKGGKIKQQYQDIVDGYTLLQQNYNRAKSEPIYA